MLEHRHYSSGAGDGPLPPTQLYLLMYPYSLIPAPTQALSFTSCFFFLTPFHGFQRTKSVRLRSVQLGKIKEFPMSLTSVSFRLRWYGEGVCYYEAYCLRKK